MTDDEKRISDLEKTVSSLKIKIVTLEVINRGTVVYVRQLEAKIKSLEAENVEGTQ